MTRLTYLLSFLTASFLIGCGGPKVQTSDPDALQQTIIIPGATRMEGNPPPPSGGSNAPAGQSTGRLVTTSGGQSELVITYTSQSGYDNCYVRIRGASGYFSIPTPSSANSGTLRIPINVPDNVASGSYSLYTCIRDTNGNVSQPIYTEANNTDPNEGKGGGNGGVPPGATCSQQTTQCTLKFCIEISSNRAWYVVNGQTFSCGSASNSQGISDCASRAGRACAGVP